MKQCEKDFKIHRGGMKTPRAKMYTYEIAIYIKFINMQNNAKHTCIYFKIMKT